jgi:hypothetical protein
MGGPCDDDSQTKKNKKRKNRKRSRGPSSYLAKDRSIQFLVLAILSSSPLPLPLPLPPLLTTAAPFNGLDLTGAAVVRIELNVGEGDEIVTAGGGGGGNNGAWVLLIALTFLE